MSVSNYVLNQRISVLQSEIDNLTPPSGGYVPVNGNITINDIKTFSTLPQSSVVPVNNDDLVNKLYVDTHGGGGSQNLSDVLLVGNSAGSSSIDMNTNAISNISTATAKTSLVVNNSVAGQNSTLTTQNLTINNAGLSNTPIITLNQSGSGNGILIEECYNQRTAQTGEFNRMSFYSKNSAGTKTEFGRIHQNAVNFTAGAIKGRMDFAVGNGAGLQDYLSLNANTGQVDILNSDLHLNANDIVSCSSITTPLANQYSKEKVEYLNTNSTAPVSVVESNLRYTAINLGKSPTWEQSGVSTNGFVGEVENITAYQNNFLGYFWVGTDLGNVYFSGDGGANWSLQGSYNGRIRCFQTYSYNTSMAVGGDFTGTYNYLVGIDSYSNSFDMTGYGGLNGAVYCMYENVANNCLYIGGHFDDFFSLTGAVSQKFFTYEYGTSTWYNFSNTSGSGFTGGDVYSITQDAGGSGFIIVGGTFTEVINAGSSTGISYLFTYQTFNGYDLSSYFSIGLALNNPVNSVLLNTNGGVLVGGSFFNTSGYSSCNTNYGFNMIWNGSNWDLYDYYFFYPSSTITSISYIGNTGVYYTIENNSTIYGGGTQYATIPTGSEWYCIAYNGSDTLFATNNQTGVGFLFYLYDFSVGITINGGGNTFNTTGGSGFTNCYMTNTNSAVEMIWNSALSKWFVISQESCSFS